MSTPESKPATSNNFLRTLIASHLQDGTHTQVVTRFPPEPNGYLHIGHAKSICLNFGLAQEFKGRCHLRMDDTNPVAEDIEYVESIAHDVRWLGFDWGAHLYYAADYFEQMYTWACELIRAGKAYVDSQTLEEIRKHRGSLSEPGVNSRFRDRSVEENLNLFERMRAGEFADGTHVLRAKIDMAHPNMIMRDPLLYRIRHAHHHRTGDAWCIYPMYDYAHPLEDAIEGITHSICTLEFENNREIYDWLMANVPGVGVRPSTPGAPPLPKQYEFARLALDYTLMSKRKLLKLVQSGTVRGWDDPRMPTIAGLRRRGFTPSSIRSFCELIGVTKANSRVDYGKLEFAIRTDLSPEVPRVMAVSRPLKVVVTSWPEGEVEWNEAPLYPHDVPKTGSRSLPFSREIFIESDDFREVPPPGWHRLTLGSEVRLRYGYVIRCTEVVRDDAGEVVALKATHDPTTRGGASPADRKVKGTIHWVSATHAVPAELRLYDHLFLTPTPDGDDWEEQINPNSLVVTRGYVEPMLVDDPAGTRYQFERLGYFISDPDSTASGLVFNRIATLRDGFAKAEKGDDSELSVVAPGKKPAAARPDTRPAKLSKTEIRQKIRAGNTDLATRYARYQADLGLSEEDADVLTGSVELADFFEETAARTEVAAAARWVINEVLRVVKDQPLAALPFGPAELATLVEWVEQGRISATAGKEVFAELVEKGGDPAELAQGREQIGDLGALGTAIDGVIQAFPEQVARYKGGNQGLLGFLMGQVMKATGGRAEPAIAKALLVEKLR
jgi:glutaminyl-tRNA synthetase